MPGRLMENFPYLPVEEEGQAGRCGAAREFHPASIRDAAAGFN